MRYICSDYYDFENKECLKCGKYEPRKKGYQCVCPRASLFVVLDSFENYVLKNHNTDTYNDEEIVWGFTCDIKDGTITTRPNTITREIAFYILDFYDNKRMSSVDDTFLEKLMYYRINM